MTMMGTSIDATTPNVIFCSDDDALDQAIRNDKSLNGMIDSTPLLDEGKALQPGDCGSVAVQIVGNEVLVVDHVFFGQHWKN